MTAAMVGTVGIVIFLACLLIGLPIWASMLGVGMIGFGVLAGFDSAFKMAPMDIFSSLASYNFSVVAMFTLMGFFAYHSGIGSKLFDFAYKCLGFMPGGLAIATEGACAAFGAICGSGPATVATIGSIAFPEMKKFKYDDTLATASVAAGGGLGLLIPPSVTAIVYGVMTETSIGRLFVGGITAGILLMILYMIAIYIMVKRKPELAPQGEKFTLKEKLASVNGGLLETIIIFAITIGGLAAGWFTPTEGGAIGAFAMFAVCLIRRKLPMKALIASLYDTARTVGMCLLLVACVTVFQRFVVISNIPQALAEALMNIDAPPKVVFLLIVLIYLIGGCFLDGLPLILITVPIFFSVVMDLGFDPVWFGVIVTMVCVMGMITPPVGINVYVMRGVTKGEISLETIFKGVWPFVGCILIAIVISLMFPQLLLFLPQLIY
ncbi:MAG: TRAP transporter large permease [Clostridiales Family XIII bacterium]|jgi:tripartite ATP-independent transporter DctM subunit|nr:TRAP transporter large permease [Clostridiales Family XIII bacterium]